jgi:hypothetical protein
VEKIVIPTEEVRLFLNELFYILVDEQYFSFPENAKAYVDKLTDYVEKYIGIFPDRDAPPYFDHYGNDLKYIIYKANKSTWWYIFYQQRENVFLIRHITNNHVAAQYFDS